MQQSLTVMHTTIKTLLCQQLRTRLWFQHTRRQPDPRHQLVGLPRLWPSFSRLSLASCLHLPFFLWVIQSTPKWCDVHLIQDLQNSLPLLMFCIECQERCSGTMVMIGMVASPQLI